MQDRELYQRIVGGVSPWTVGEIVESDGQRLEVQVESNDAFPQRCPYCGSMLLVCDHGEEQTWRQPDAGPWQILLKGRLPLIECPEHGIVGVSPPWADWYVRGLDKSLLGPWSLQQLKLLLDAGRISSSTLLKRGSSDKWVIAGMVGALFVNEDETHKPPMPVDELAARDSATANKPAAAVPVEGKTLDCIPTISNLFADDPSFQTNDQLSGSIHEQSLSDCQTSQPPTTHSSKLPQADVDAVSAQLNEVRSDATHDPMPSLESPPSSAPAEADELAATCGESSPLELTVMLEQTAAAELAATVVQTSRADDAAEPVDPAILKADKADNAPAAQRKPKPAGWTLPHERAVNEEHTANVARTMPAVDDRGPISTIETTRWTASPESEELPIAIEEPSFSESSVPLKRTAEMEQTAMVAAKTPADAAREPLSSLESSPSSGTVEAEGLPDTGGESWPAELTFVHERTAEEEFKAKIARKTPPDDTAAQRFKPATRQPDRTPAAQQEPAPSQSSMSLKRIAEEEHQAKTVRKTSAGDAAAPRVKPATRVPEKTPDTNDEPNPAEWSISSKRSAKSKRAAKVVRKKSSDGAAAPRDKPASRRHVLVRRHEFQHGYQLLTIAYLVNACLVALLVPAVCMNFFARLLVLSASVFIPFHGGDTLSEGQLVACGLAALSMLVFIGFPVWHLVSNGGVLWHYVPGALLGTALGFGIPPDYLDELCTALQWCEFGFGITAAGLTMYMLFAVSAKSSTSIPIMAAGLMTAISAITLCFVRSGSMLFIQVSTIPPQFRGALPDASLYVFGLYGTLIFIPAAMMFELYQHADYESRQFIIRSSVILGGYLLAGIATLGCFVHGARSGFFDVPLALVPLGCINAVAAGIPSILSLVDPQYSVSDD